MKITYLLALLCIFSIESKASTKDTLDYVHVYRNGKMIIDGSTLMTVEISKKLVMETDEFDIHFFTDAPSITGNYVSIQNSSGEEVGRIESYQSYKYKIRTKQLLEMGLKNKEELLTFYLVDGELKSPTRILGIRIK